MQVSVVRLRGPRAACASRRPTCESTRLTSETWSWTTRHSSSQHAARASGPWTMVLTCIHIHNTFPFITCRRSRTLTTALARIQRATLKAFAVPRPALRTLFTQNVECCIWRLKPVTPAIAATALAPSGPMLLFPRSSSCTLVTALPRSAAQRTMVPTPPQLQDEICIALLALGTNSQYLRVKQAVQISS